jgi:AAA15 family ATPase/GTPase
MKITKFHLENFKRFTSLTVTEIPNTNKLVLIIGTNGSGKSSVFDAFDWLNKGNSKEIPYSQHEGLNYYRKNNEAPSKAEITIANGENILKQDWAVKNNPELAKRFIGRSSIRIVSRIANNANPNNVATDQDSPQTYIENDQRFTTDVFLYIQSINRALREPVFSGKQADTLKIFQDFIYPFNNSLKNIFGDNPLTTIRIAEFEDATPQAPAKLIFKKGGSKINYDYLSHGEKQVVILLLNFIVRQEYYKDAIIFIDEMDVHLNTKLQYNTLKEITESWIPDSSQLWTASHALGFIEYANDNEAAAILDFDDLDFDKPQIIKPSRKNDYQVFELAVSKEFIEKVFQGKTIIFAEQTDAPIYNDLGFENIIFFDGKDKLGAFHKAKELNLRAIIDRDYLTDEEINTLKSTYPFLTILPYYSIENLFYHPQNLLEYYGGKNIAFDKGAYEKKLLEEKNKEIAYISAGVAKARDGYPFFKENEFAKSQQIFKGNTKAIIDLLASNDFETFYKVLPAKDYGTTISERQQIDKRELAKTNWFKLTIKSTIGG